MTKQNNKGKIMGDSNAVANSFSAGVRPTLDLVDDLRKLGLQKDVPIPQIAVMGDQSSGKSSVLEAISGIPFPRGAGLVTRCATQISMSQGATWSAKLNCKGSETITVADPAEITKAIEEMTNALCGEAEFSEEIITVKLVGPNTPDLTLIDLPGIVRTTTEGQSETKTLALR